MTQSKLSYYYYYSYALIFVLLILPTIVNGECTCDNDDLPNDSESLTMKYKLGAIGAILSASAIGVGIPLLAKNFSVLSPQNDIFFIIKAFAAGVILATGFIHILPDAFEGLTSPCIGEKPWQKFPFAAFIAMVAAIGSFMVDTLATGHYRKVHFGEKSKVVDEENDDVHVHDGHIHVHTHATHGHAHGGGDSFAIDDGQNEGKLITKLQLIRHRVTAQVLELGIVVHSVIIGISLGTSQRVDTIKPLMVALCFHQFFEGMGLGGCITQAKFKSRAVAIMALFFSLTTPVGVALGMAIAGVYNDNSPRSLIVQAIFEAASAGILIYMALVDLLAADFMNPRMQANTRIHLGSHLSLLLGAACMSSLAIWA